MHETDFTLPNRERSYVGLHTFHIYVYSFHSVLVDGLDTVGNGMYTYRRKQVKCTKAVTAYSVGRLGSSDRSNVGLISV